MPSGVSKSLIGNDETSNEDTFVHIDDDDDSLYDDDDDIMEGDGLPGVGSHRGLNQVGIDQNQNQDAASMLRLALEVMQQTEMEFGIQNQRKTQASHTKRPAKKGSSPKAKPKMSKMTVTNKKQGQTISNCRNSESNNLEDNEELMRILANCPPYSPSATNTSSPSKNPNKNSKKNANKNSNKNSNKPSQSNSNPELAESEIDEIMNKLLATTQFPQSDIDEILSHLFSGGLPTPPLSASAQKLWKQLTAPYSTAKQSTSDLIAETQSTAAPARKIALSTTAATAATARTNTPPINDVRQNTNTATASNWPTDGAIDVIHADGMDVDNHDDQNDDDHANNIDNDYGLDDDNDAIPNDIPDGHNERPTPLFLPSVPEIMPILDGINKVIGSNNYYTKPTANQGLRVQCSNIASYRKLVTHFRQQNIQCHTYQLQSDRGYRFVIRYLHHSTPDVWIRQQLTNLGYKVRYVSNIKKRFTRQKLNLFEVEIETSSNSKDVLQITSLGGQRVRMEKTMRNADAVQCHRCQKFGHTKNYCRRPFVCVKCSGSHPSTECERRKGDNNQTPPKCANCQGNHAASYRGCKAFKDACKLKISKGVQIATKLVAELSRVAKIGDNTATISTIQRNLRKANQPVQQPPRQQQQQQQQPVHSRKQQPQLKKNKNIQSSSNRTPSFAEVLRTGHSQPTQQQQQQPIRNRHANQQPLIKQQHTKQQPLIQKQQQQTLQQVLQQHMNQLEQQPQQQQPTQQPLQQVLLQQRRLQRQRQQTAIDTENVADDPIIQSRHSRDAIPSVDSNQKLDMLIDLMLEEQRTRIAAASHAKSLEEKLDKLVHLMSLMASHHLSANNT